MAAFGETEPTLASLLDRADLRLSLVGPRAAGDPRLERPIRWVHSSDLADPTPFLADDLVLLTTGTQFDGVDAAAAAGYVQRLHSRGVIALGFGTEVVREGLPAGLAEACAAAGLPLFLVPYGTPFIAIARANAEAVAAQAYARRSWALAAQRAISLAALRPDGLGATLAELARQLDAWVGLYDAAGALTREFPHPLDEPTRRELASEAQTVLHRGARAASALEIEGRPFTLQTLGRGGHLRGVIAIASNELDQEGRGVVTSVIAMAGLALEQHQGVTRARGALRAGLAEALAAGHVDFARRVSRESSAPLPAAPVRVHLVDAGPRTDPVSEWLDLRAAEDPGSVFFAEADGALLVVARADDDALPAEVARRAAAATGQSDAVDYDEFAEAVGQARLARERGGSGVVSFADARSVGVLATLTDDSRVVADGILAPLRRHDAEQGSALLPTLQAFLEHDGSHEATAAALGVHRHTVRSRVAAAEAVLGLSLRTFPARAELWAALVAADA